MVILGYSGTGKSVALKHIVGLLEPDSGQVEPDHYLGLWEPGVWKSDYLDGSYGDYFGKNVGQAHLVMAVHQDDVQALAGRLTAAGYEIVGPMPHGDGSLHLYVSDPDGHAIEFWGKQA